MAGQEAIYLEREVDELRRHLHEKTNWHRLYQNALITRPEAQEQEHVWHRIEADVAAQSKYKSTALAAQANDMDHLQRLFSDERLEVLRLRAKLEEAALRPLPIGSRDARPRMRR